MASVRVHRRDGQGRPTIWKVVAKDDSGEWRSTYYKSEKEATRASLEAGINELSDGSESRGRNTLFLLAWTEFIERNKVQYRSNTLNNFHRAKMVFESTIVRISDITTRNVIDALLKHGQHRTRTRITYISKLKRFVKWCSHNKYDGIDVDWKIVTEETLGRIVDDKRFLTVEEYRKIRSWIFDKGFHSRAALIELLAERGFRIQEILKSTIEDIDFIGKSITIRPEIEKTGKSRTVYLGDYFISVIKQRREEYNKSNSNAIFICEQTGGPLKYKTVVKWWRICCRELGIVKKPIHRLRAYAFFLIYKSSNHNLELAKQICGWQSSAYKYYVSSFRQEMPLLDWSIRKFSSGWTTEGGHGSVGEKIKSIIEGEAGTSEKIMSALDIDKYWMDNFMLFGWNNDLVRIEKICNHLGYQLTLSDIRPKKSKIPPS